MKRLVKKIVIAEYGDFYILNTDESRSYDSKEVQEFLKIMYEMEEKEERKEKENSEELNNSTFDKIFNFLKSKPLKLVIAGFALISIYPAYMANGLFGIGAECFVIIICLIDYFVP